MKKFIPITLAVVYLLTFSFWSGMVDQAEAAYTATLSFANPSNGGSVSVNVSNQFSIDLVVNTGGQASTGADAIVTFDSSKLNYVSVSYGSSYDAHGPNPAAGSGSPLNFGVYKNSGSFTGTGTIATLTFSVKTGVTLPTNVSFNYGFTSQGSSTDSNVVITNGSGDPEDILSSVSPAAITITAYVASAPDITLLNPTSGTTVGGTPVVVTGTNFGTAGTVTFGGTTVTPTGRTDTSMTVTSPAHAAGLVYIVVTNSATGLSSSSSDAQAAFTYVAPSTDLNDPNINNLNPSSGRADTDVRVTITGMNFGATAGTVKFGSFVAQIISWSDTQVVVWAPRVTGIVADVSYPVTLTRASDSKSATASYIYLASVSTGGGDDGTADTTPASGMPAGVWLGLIPLNGLLALVVKRWLF